MKKKEEKYKSSVLRIVKHVRNYFILAAALLSNMGEGIFHVLIAAASGMMVDYIILYNTQQAKQKMLMILLYVLGLAVCILVKDCLLGEYLERGMRRLRQKTVESLTHARLSWLDMSHTGDLSSRVSNDLNILADALRPVLIMGISLVVVHLIAVGYMFYKDWLLTLIVFALVPITSLLQWVYSSSIKKYKMKSLSAVGELTSVASDCFGSYEMVKSIALENEILQRFAAAQSKQLEAEKKEQKAAAILTPIGKLGEFLPRFLLFGIGGIFVINGRLTFGQLIAYISLSGGAIYVLGSIMQLIISIRQLDASSSRIIEIWDIPSEILNGNSSIAAYPGYVLDFNKVEFSYGSLLLKKQERVLKNISFRVKKGQCIAIVGESGCGKSTVLCLGATLYHPQEGVISILGRDVNDWSLEEVRNHISYVSQDTFLFPGTLYENITCGQGNFSKEQVMECIEKVSLTSFVNKLSKGLDSIVGERGVFLSGGEKQRISIARALLKKPELLLLDEVTSAMDAETEKHVIKSIMNTENKPAVIFITHRLSSIKAVDKILVMAHGTIVERGTHSELIQANGQYKHLVMQQEMEGV